jgi:hypothetical protein
MSTRYRPVPVLDLHRWADWLEPLGMGPLLPPEPPPRHPNDCLCAACLTHAQHLNDDAKARRLVGRF